MRSNRDRNWDAIAEHLSSQASGKEPRLFSSRRTLFGIPSALDQELAALTDEALRPAFDAKTAPDGKGGANEPSRVVHPLDPVFDERSKTLILGTMPSPKSREVGFYYGHPQNRFWKVLSAIYDEKLPETNDQRRDLVLRHELALWDVLAECTIQGASDMTIAECVPNDIASITTRAPIEKIICTGTKAAELYDRYCKDSVGIECAKLPSTSSANAATSLEQLICAYGKELL